MKIGMVPALRCKSKDLSETSNLFEAHLMSPNEVAISSRGCSTKLKQTLDGRWLLSGVVSSKVFSALNARTPRDTVISVELFSMPSDAAYALVRCEFGRYSHLFLLPLYLERVRNFFAAATTGPSHFQFINESGSDGYIFDSDALPKEFLSYLKLNNVIKFHNASDLVRELIYLVSNVTEMNGSSATGERQIPQDVDVSILMPYEYLDAREDEVDTEIAL